MILPYFSGIVRFGRAPVTWLLVAINAFIMVVTYSDLMRSDGLLDEAFRDDYFISNQGRFYAEFIEDNQKLYSPFLRKLASISVHGDQEKSRLLGNMALRNEKFLLEGPSYPFSGDQVARLWWADKVEQFKKVQAHHPSFVWGLNIDHLGPFNWISYQFVHSGFLHFIFNMAFLLIFGAFLEIHWGGLLVLLVYLGSGVVGAATFILANGASLAPLIGASAAISGLMAVVCVLYWRTGVKCLYWLFIPLKGYSGFIHLPAGFIFFLWLAADLAGYFGTLDELGGIAHAAHLGGQASGVIVGASLLLIEKARGDKAITL